MIVSDEDGGGVETDRLAEELADTDDSGVERADVDGVLLEYVVLGVENQCDEVLLFVGTHFEHEQVGRVGGRLDHGLFGWLGDLQSAAKLERRLEAGGAGGADALDRRKVGHGQTGQAGQVVIGRE